MGSVPDDVPVPVSSLTTPETSHHHHHHHQPTPRKLKILMLHGYAQSGPTFRSKTNALRKHLERAFLGSSKSNPNPNTITDTITNTNEPYEGVELIYPTAPLRLHGADIPGFETSLSSSTGTEVEEDLDAWGWWRKDVHSGTYLSLETGLDFLSSILRTEGPFDGVVGFSQGGAMAGMIASLLEHGRFDAFQHSHGKGKGMGMGYPQSYISHKGGSETVIHPPLKFVVVYSGFKAMQECYQAFYEPKIKTPVMHFLGRVDSVVEENRSLALVDACEVEQVVYHPGGHFVPSQRVYLERVVEFVRSCLEKE